MGNSVDPDQMPSSAGLISVYTVCQGLSARLFSVNLVLKSRKQTTVASPIKLKMYLSEVNSFGGKFQTTFVVWFFFFFFFFEQTIAW